MKALLFTRLIMLTELIVCTMALSACGGTHEAEPTSNATASVGVGTATTTTTPTTGAGAPATTSTDVTWVKCAPEDGTCSFSGTREIRYGTLTQTVSKVVTGEVSCANATFGDPAVGANKDCWYAASPAEAIPAAASDPAPAAAPATATTPGAFSGPVVASAFVQRAEIVASDGLSASVDRGNGHGGHQPRHTRHSDGTERMVYVGGEFDGPNRWWKLMKRPANGSWQLEAQGQSNNEAILFRDPTTDRAHVISYPGAVPHISSAPAFNAVPIPGTWQNQGSPYLGLGVGADGTVVLVNYYDQLLGGVYTKDTERHWASAKWNGSGWTWGPVQKKYIGLRRAYNYVIPGAFGNAAEWAGISEWAGKKEFSAPLVAGSFIWDGIYEERALINDAQSHRLADIIPQRTSPTETVAAWMAIQDSFTDSKGRMFTLVNVSDPNGPSGMYLTVRNSSGQLHQGIVSGLGGGNPRIIEDAKGRLWLIELGDTSRIFRLNDNFTLGAATTLTFPFQYNGFGRIAAPRGGNTIGDTIYGSFPSGTQMIAYAIRLPD